MLKSFDRPTVHLLGNLLTYLKLPDDSPQSYAIVECRTAPGAGAPMNRHDEDETFVVIDGQVEFTVGRESQIASPGDVVTVPNGVAHVFTNVGEAVSTMLLIHRPGDAHVRFFFGAGEAVAEGTTEFPEMAPPDVPRLVAVAAEAGVDILAQG